MNSGQRITTFLLVGATFLLSFAVTFVVLSGVGFIGLDPFRVQRATVYSFVGVVAALGCAFLLARLVARARTRRWNGPANLFPRSKWVVVPLIAAYLLTWAVGVPAVQSANTASVIDEAISITRYTIDTEKPGLGIQRPYTPTYLSFPVLPFVVASLRAEQTTGLSGWGGWDVQVWYGVGTHRLFRLTLFMS